MGERTLQRSILVLHEGQLAVDAFQFQCAGTTHCGHDRGIHGQLPGLAVGT